jgi:hypothetical protein
MTPSEIILAARQRYNAVGDTNWSDSEICSLIYFGELQLFTELGMVIENTFTTSTVASTREYAYPSNASTIRRIEYNGKKLFPITFRDDDSLTNQNEVTTDTGTPEYYEIFDSTIYLRPIPDTVGTLKMFANCEPQAVTTNSTLEIPSFTHGALVDYVVAEMAAKDLNFNMAKYYRDIWQNIHIPSIKKRIKLNRRGDAFAVVQSEELLPHGSLGAQ